MSCLELISVYYVHYRSIKVSYVSIGIEWRKVYIGIELNGGEVPNPSVLSSHIFLHLSCVWTILANRPIISMCPCQLGLELGRAGTNISHLGKIEKCLEKGNMLYIYIIPRRVYIFNIHIIHIMYNIYINISIYIEGWSGTFGIHPRWCVLFSIQSRVCSLFFPTCAWYSAVSCQSRNMSLIWNHHTWQYWSGSVWPTQEDAFVRNFDRSSHIWRCSSWGIATASC